MNFCSICSAGQWAGLKTYTNEQGIEIIGDIPIYVALTVQIPGRIQKLFQLDEENLPVAVVGCPPDGIFRQPGSCGGIHCMHGITIRRQAMTGG